MTDYRDDLKARLDDWVGFHEDDLHGAYGIHLIADSIKSVLDEHGPDPGWGDGPEGPNQYCRVCLTRRDGYQETWTPDPWPCRTVLFIARVLRVKT